MELGYLREYRRKGVPLQKLRPVIDDLREAFGTPYPFATAKPCIYDKELVLKIQERAGLPSAIAIVVRSGQEVLLTPETQRFFTKVEFDANTPDGLATRIRPAGATSPVTTDPLVRFGRSAVEGIATERLWELFDAGESVAEIAVAYEISENDVSAAISDEEQFRTLVA